MFLEIETLCFTWITIVVQGFITDTHNKWTYFEKRRQCSNITIMCLDNPKFDHSKFHIKILTNQNGACKKSGEMGCIGHD